MNAATFGHQLGAFLLPFVLGYIFLRIGSRPNANAAWRWIGVLLSLALCASGGFAVGGVVAVVIIFGWALVQGRKLR